MSFAVLPRRDTNPEIARARPPVDDGDARTRASRVRCSTSWACTCVDATAASIDVPVIDWSLNSMGAMQGGVVATVADVAAETALRAATNEPLVVSDLQVTYLGFGRVGPVRTRAGGARRVTGHAAAARRARRRRRREPADDVVSRGGDPGASR